MESASGTRELFIYLLYTEDLGGHEMPTADELQINFIFLENRVPSGKALVTSNGEYDGEDCQRVPRMLW